MSTELIDTENKPTEPMPHDMRHAMMALPVEQQNKLLTEYVDRRNNFRRWLKEQLEEGVHYGFPPGCLPKNQPNPKQWVSQPSLYAAGADLIIDLLALRSEFTADLQAWQQLGSPAETFVIHCTLFSRATGELIGEGRGVRRVGQKGGDANNAIKMAQKSARVDAVLNCYGLRELFTQDLEVPGQPPHDNPERNEKAPTAPPRAMRIAPEVVKVIPAEWQVQFGSGDKARDKALYVEWVKRTTGRDFNPLTYSLWTAPDVDKCAAALGMPVDNQEGIPF